MFKTADDTEHGDHPDGLKRAHLLITKLAGHVGALVQKLGRHEERLNSHEQLHQSHANMHSQHEARLRALESASGISSPPATYKQTVDQLRTMGRDFRERIRNRA